MGNKTSKKSDESDSLHPQEKRKLTDFLQQKEKTTTSFTLQEIQKLWHEVLVPNLMESYTKYLFKNQGQKKSLSIEQFITIYVNIIRGSPKEKASVITSIIGTKKNQEGDEVISFHSLCNYLKNLMESYFCGLKHQSDLCYISWTQTHEPSEHTIEEVIKGVCNDLPRTNDEVRVDLFERWLHQCALVNQLHSYVLGSMYNLSPEQESDVIPMAHLPMKRLSNKGSFLLDVSQVVYLNSFLPVQNKEEWRFLFSIDVNGESYSKFVACIVNQGPVLIVVQSNSNGLFGGFISTNLTLSPKWTGTPSCFLFTLGSRVDVYPATGYNDHYAYFNNHQTTLPNGLGMGGQFGYWGLWIDSHFGVGECSESCTTYKNYIMLDKNKKFNIKSIEVWGVGEPPPTEEERGVRQTTKGKSALDQDPTSTQILEMAGRELHSKHIRERSESK